jgi:hypothetical protein
MNTMIPPLYPSQSSLDRLRLFGIYWMRLCRLAENAPDEVFRGKGKPGIREATARYHWTTQA